MSDADEKLKIIVNKKLAEIQQQTAVPVDTSPVTVLEVDESPRDEVLQDDLEDTEGVCYALRRRPGEAPSLECWFKDNALLAFSYGYLRQVRLNPTHEKLLLLFVDGKVMVTGRGLYEIARGINERKITRIIEQHSELDLGADNQPFIYAMVAEVEEIEGF